MLPDHYEVRFNKYHGKDGKFSSHSGGGGGDYRPGHWTESKVDREAKIAEMEAHLKEHTSPMLRKAMEESQGPNWEHNAAIELVDSSPAGTVYRNGPHVVSFNSPRVTEAQQKELLAEVDKLQQTAPIKGQIELKVEPRENFPFGVGGETYLGAGHIRISDTVYRDYDNQGKKWSSWDPKGAMPAAQSVKASTYVLHHEWGHAVDDKGSETHLNSYKGMSGYGQQNHREGFAEAFAEWSLTGGQTTNEATNSYADLAGWREKWPSLVTTSSKA